MTETPFTVTLPFSRGVPSRVENHIKRPLSSLRGTFADEGALDNMLLQDDTLVYEVLEIKHAQVEGDVAVGVSIVHPGKVGSEFFMTRGHFHSAPETAEVHYCLQGEGYMVMETSEGDSSVAALRPGALLYVPPRWAHRFVCTSRQADLVTLFVYPGRSVHDSAPIEQQGFRKLVIDAGNGIEFVDSPRWKK